MELLQEIAALRDEVAELKQILLGFVSPATSVSIAEKARILRAAHASGDRVIIRNAGRLINNKKGDPRTLSQAKAK